MTGAQIAKRQDSAQEKAEENRGEFGCAKNLNRKAARDVSDFQGSRRK
jgi:hypothetical protein